MDSCKDIDELSDVTCSYVSFCESMIIPTKMIKVYPNNIPWMTKAVKSSLQRKTLSLRQGEVPEREAAKKELKVEILKAKRKYRAKVENKLADGNLASAWSGMKTIAGIQQKEQKQHCYR